MNRHNSGNKMFGLLLRLKPVIRRVLPASILEKKRERVYAAVNRADWETAETPEALAEGVTLFGLMDEPSGVGESARRYRSAIDAAGIPMEVHTLHSGAEAGLLPGGSDVSPYGTSLFVFNADCAGFFLRQIGAGILKGRYNIACWSWELPEFPARWKNSFSYFDEIWTLSDYCRDSIAAASPVPVHTVPCCVEPEPDVTLTRSRFSLPESRTLFLAMADMRSIAGRKNPAGAVRAYLKAFPEDNGKTGLVLKVYGVENSREGIPELHDLCRGRNDVFFLREVYSKTETEALIGLCDVFVSLHRAEGFGFPIAEAMALGRAVIVTGWSGNMDFTNEQNACCVPYTPVPVSKHAEPPYDAQQIWAEPDEDRAAEFFLRLAGDESLRRRLGEAGAQTIRQKYSAAAAAAAVQERLRRAGQI